MSEGGRPGSSSPPPETDAAAASTATDGRSSSCGAPPFPPLPQPSIPNDEAVESDSHATTKKECGGTKKPKPRPDLFFTGVVVLINGYTEPDAATLQRMLQRHGGDVERYETSRVTHVIAERLSAAKAAVYLRQRQCRTPVCRPAWIVDSVQARTVLPARAYGVDAMKGNARGPSVASFFRTAARGGGGGGEHATRDDDDDDTNGGRTACTAAGVAPDPSRQDLVDAASRSVETGEAVGAMQQPSPVDVNSSEVVVVVGAKQPSPVDDVSREPVVVDGTQQSPVGGHGSVPIAAVDAAVAVTRSEDGAAAAAANATSAVVVKNDDRYIHGRIRTVGTDPHFLDSFFAASRLSFIGSYRQRARQQSPAAAKTKQSRQINPGERYVFHVDMDCFFASVALRKFPEYRDKPVAISHHGVKHGDAAGGSVPKDSWSECATCNYVARKFGVKKGMFLGRAKALCPDLVVLMYDFEGYEEVSKAVSHILDRHAAENAGYVEHVSCDEAYVEFHLPPCLNGASPAAVAAELAETIRNEIFEVTQCTATVGVANNKLLAKLATDRVKPNGTFVVNDARDVLQSLKLRELCGIGYRMEGKLVEEDLVSVQDVWDLGHRGETELCRILGPALGKKIYGFCQGIDDRLVQPAERKTIGAEVSVLLCMRRKVNYTHAISFVVSNIGFIPLV